MWPFSDKSKPILVETPKKVILYYYWWKCKRCGVEWRGDQKVAYPYIDFNNSFIEHICDINNENIRGIAEIVGYNNEDHPKHQSMRNGVR